ncbi:MAG: spore cortex biosynthesis protein YabQ [Bacilli bacterium]|jgi:hypothetical protein
MSLAIQIKSLIFCFIYGLFFSIIYNLNSKYIYDTKKWYKISISILFILDNVLLFYLILLKINYGIIHPYFILMLIIGFYIGNKNYPMIKARIFKNSK